MFARLKAYAGLMRLNRPWPILLILFPTYWGLFVGPNPPSVGEFIIFSLGVFLTRSAGCVINDYFDRKIDGFVTRTKNRPLQTGVIRSREAIFFFLVLMGIAFLLALLLAPQVILLAGLAFLLALFYPLAKRVTYFPQVVLGCAFNFGLVMAALQVNGHITWIAWAYYAWAIIWTVHYDTLYALADYEDDMRIGVKSIATFFQGHVYQFLGATSLLSLLGVAGIWGVSGFSSIRLIMLMALLLFFVYQYQILLIRREKVGLRLFKQHVWVGLFILIGVVF